MPSLARSALDTSGAFVCFEFKLIPLIVRLVIVIYGLGTKKKILDRTGDVNGPFFMRKVAQGLFAVGSTLRL